MTVLDRFRHLSLELSEEEANRLATSRFDGYTVEARPPRNQSLPATLDDFLDTITEFQTRWFGLRNTSPVYGFEIRRKHPERLTLQYTVPSKRLERKVRTQLPNTVPEVTLREGTTGLPVVEGSVVGGGLLTTGRPDWNPLRTDLDNPGTDSVVAALHRDVLPQSKFIIQILFQPVAGQPVRKWIRRKRVGQKIRFLRDDKHTALSSRSATPREKNQANEIDDKAGSPQYRTSIRFVFTDAGEWTRSRVKELGGAFNIYSNADTEQYLKHVTADPFRRKELLRFFRAVADREFRGWSRSFRSSAQELAALVALPSRKQENLVNSHP